jgi:hypothetical protein
MGFFGQTQVQNQPAQAVAGDRASQNPMATFDAGPGGLVAGPNGVTVGNFAWVTAPTDPNGTGQLAVNAGGGGYGSVAGLVYNDLQALDTVFLSDATLLIPQGLPVALAIQGDFWVINNGTTEAIPNVSKAYANFADGSVTFAAASAPTAGASATGSTVTPETFSVTASIAGDLMTVTAVGSGSVYPGATTSGTNVTTGTKIASQVLPLLSGEAANGVGRYLLTISQQQNIASESISGTYGLLTIGTLTTTGTFAVGQVLQVTGSVVANTHITANVSGSGGSGGTMIVDNNTSLSQTIATYANVETKWYAASAGGKGALVKITSWVGTQG